MDEFDLEKALQIDGQDESHPSEEPENNPSKDPEIGDQLVDVVIMGQAVKVTPEAAQILEEREREFNRKLSENSQELGNLRKFKEERVSSEDFEHNPSSFEDDKLEELWFTSPKEAVSILEKNMAQELKRAKDEIKKDLRLEEAVRKREKVFWDKFYGNNPDLKRADKIVKTILAEEWESLSTIQSEDVAQKALAGKVRAYLSGLVSSSEPQSLRAEPSGEPPKPKAIKEEHLNTLSELLRRRRSKRLGGIKLA